MRFDLASFQFLEKLTDIAALVGAYPLGNALALCIQIVEHVRRGLALGRGVDVGIAGLEAIAVSRRLLLR